MKKTYLYLAVLIVLMAVGGYNVYKNRTATKAKESADFSVKNTSEITRIFLKDKEAKEMLLEKTEDGWLLNQKYKANQQFVNELLDAFANMYAFAPLASVAQDNAVKQMSVKSTRVEVYTKDKSKPYKVFYVGGVSPSKKGTNMLLEIDGKVAGQVQEVRLPGLNGYITDRFYIDESLWRETLLFDFHSNDIQQVSIDYYGEKSYQSFTLSNQSGNYTLQTKDGKFENNQLYADLVTSYLLGFGKKTVEIYANDYALMDSIIINFPLADLRIKDLKGKEVKIRFFNMPSDPKSKQQFDDEGEKIPFDVDRYYALVNDEKDFAVLQVYTFGAILANPFVFIRK